MTELYMGICNSVIQPGEETAAVVKLWEDIRNNKSLGCVISEKPVDQTNAFKLKISSLADFYDVLLHGQFSVKNESKASGRIREGDVVRAKSNWIREGTVEGFKEDEKGKKRASVLLSFSLSWVLVIHVFMSSVHSLNKKGTTLAISKMWWTHMPNAKESASVP